MEEELYQAQSTEQAQDKTNQYLLQKLEEQIEMQRHISEALGISGPYTMEWAHRMGGHSADRTSPRPIVAKYLNYADKAAILQKYRQSKSLQID